MNLASNIVNMLTPEEIERDTILFVVEQLLAALPPRPALPSCRREFDAIAKQIERLNERAARLHALAKARR